MFTSVADDVVPGYNMKLFSGMISALAEHESSVAIPVKSYSIGYLSFNAKTVYSVGIVAIFILPLGLLIAGLVIWLRRRKK
jgi:ABC-2 type transport system permease protein